MASGSRGRRAKGLMEKDFKHWAVRKASTLEDNGIGEASTDPIKRLWNVAKAHFRKLGIDGSLLAFFPDIQHFSKVWGFVPYRIKLDNLTGYVYHVALKVHG